MFESKSSGRGSIEVVAKQENQIMLYLVDRLTRDVGCYFSVLGIYFAHTTERKILRMKFNEKLIEIRKKQGLSQEELGMELQVSRQTISKWETGVSLR